MAFNDDNDNNFLESLCGLLVFIWNDATSEGVGLSIALYSVIENSQASYFTFTRFSPDISKEENNGPIPILPDGDTAAGAAENYIVHFTAHGSFYHNDKECHKIKRPKISSSTKKSAPRRLRPCSVCFAGPADATTDTEPISDQRIVHYTAHGNCIHNTKDCDIIKRPTIRSSSKNSVPIKLKACRFCADGEPERSGPTITNPNALYFRTPKGKVYHVRKTCKKLARAKTIHGLDKIPRRLRPCNDCYKS